MVEILVRDSPAENGPPTALGSVIKRDGEVAAKGLQVIGLILKAKKGSRSFRARASLIPIEIVDGPYVTAQTSTASTTPRLPLLCCLRRGNEPGREVEKRRVSPDGEDGRVDAAEKVDKPALF
ncbi:hypothetical protein NEUTE1DRAFT_96177, partial [Neurospora tetrasperma FGSC 2508]